MTHDFLFKTIGNHRALGGLIHGALHLVSLGNYARGYGKLQIFLKDISLKKQKFYTISKIFEADFKKKRTKPIFKMNLIFLMIIKKKKHSNVSFLFNCKLAPVKST